jgi:hypothetical protein
VCDELVPGDPALSPVVTTGEGKGPGYIAFIESATRPPDTGRLSGDRQQVIEQGTLMGREARYVSI